MHQTNLVNKPTMSASTVGHERRNIKGVRFGMLTLYAILGLYCGLAPSALAQLSANGLTMLNGFNSTFLYNSGGTAYCVHHVGSSAYEGGWVGALDIEGEEDAYEVTGSPTEQAIINNMLNSFLSFITPTNQWSGDPWNDDIGWESLAMARGYQMTGNPNFLAAAEYGFNMAFNRGWDTTYDGGGIWEIQPQQGQPLPGKNPLACDSLGKTAIIIYQCTGDQTYYNKAKQIYDWVWGHLFVPSSGLVCGNIDVNGVVNTTPNVYNQGTFADFANLLYESGAGGTYLNDAENAINYVIKNETTGGIVTDTDTNLNTWADDFSRAIAHVCGYTPSLWSTYYPFMANNANAIFNNRLANYNITWNGWAVPTPYNEAVVIDSSEFVSALAMAVFTPAAQPPTSIAGTHYVMNKFSQLVLDDPGYATGNGTNIIQWVYGGSANQRWTFTKNSDGSYTIINAYSGKALEDPGFSKTNGTDVDQWSSNGGSNQHWTVTPNQDGTYTIVNQWNGQALEDPGFSTANGTFMDMWPSNGGPNQHWFLH